MTISTGEPSPLLLQQHKASSIRYCKIIDLPSICNVLISGDMSIVEATHIDNALSFVRSCPDNQWKTLYFRPHRKLSFIKKLIKILLNYRRPLCEFEHMGIERQFQNVRIANKTFANGVGFPEYPSYDLLAALLLSKQAVPQSAKGMWLEFGVAEGSSINITGHSMSVRGLRDAVEVYGFDSFEGLPYDWVSGFEDQYVIMDKGAFSRGGISPPVLSNVNLVKGWFDDTLPLFIKNRQSVSEEKQRLVGVSVDNDLYDGARMILEKLHPFMGVGTILHFHELVSSVEGKNPMAELQALVEFLGNHTMSLELVPVRASFTEVAAFVVTNICCQNPLSNL